MTLREARDAYFAASGFDTSTYTDAWVELTFLRLPLRFPNTAQRRAVIERHDLHHALTGYDSTWAGEAEIGAWEVSTGCGRLATAWALNLSAMSIGLVIHPVRTFRAFVRGGRTSNLYGSPLDRAVLEEEVETVRQRLGLGAASSRPRASASDVARFSVAGLAALGAGALTVAVGPALLVAGAAGRLASRGAR